MPNIFFIHGVGGFPEENWFPWLKTELEKLGARVFIPAFPTIEYQTLENWVGVFKEYEKYLDENSIIIGHSLGVAFILNLLERPDKPVRLAFLIGGMASQLDNPEFDPGNATFLEKKFDWETIKQNCKKFYIFQSDNDPYIPYEKAEELSKFLNTEITIVKNAGHFNEKAGYTKFELLLEKIKEEL